VVPKGLSRKVKEYILGAPAPFLLGVIVPQTLPDFTNDGTVATLLLGVWVTLWFLDKIGKLPGKVKQDEEQDKILKVILRDLTHKIDEMSKAITELRVEIANKK